MEMKLSIGNMKTKAQKNKIKLNYSKEMLKPCLSEVYNTERKETLISQRSETESTFMHTAPSEIYFNTTSFSKEAPSSKRNLNFSESKLNVSSFKKLPTFFYAISKSESQKTSLHNSYAKNNEFQNDKNRSLVLVKEQHTEAINQNNTYKIDDILLKTSENNTVKEVHEENLISTEKGMICSEEQCDDYIKKSDYNNYSTSTKELSDNIYSMFRLKTDQNNQIKKKTQTLSLLQKEVARSSSALSKKKKSEFNCLVENKNKIKLEAKMNINEIYSNCLKFDNSSEREKIKKEIDEYKKDLICIYNENKKIQNEISYEKSNLTKLKGDSKWLSLEIFKVKQDKFKLNFYQQKYQKESFTLKERISKIVSLYSINYFRIIDYLLQKKHQYQQ